ncbi:hypothetical protein [Cytobacillus oceanisediminis]|uniref:hypothetical protein n=1 Tax=Cytobacillus oceanisediminis TaxID=665099 RepID=UPI001C23252E|nr:hypothetical protein [Cytobacillus oceanisediminis]MBU8773193.1 hypothetical protein [Cytobacillus oceanisediminis]
MNNQFFPNDEEELNFVMRIYEGEINTRNDWIKENARLLNEAKSASIVINHAMAIINHAMLVLRLIDIEAVGARLKDKEKAIERATILNNRNQGIPKPPKTLRNIRNDYEHFEARLDKWATSSNPSMYIDLIVGGEEFIFDNIPKDTFRKLEGSNLTFWNTKIDLQEVINWVEEVCKIINESNNRARF